MRSDESDPGSVDRMTSRPPVVRELMEQLDESNVEVQQTLDDIPTVWVSRDRHSPRDHAPATVR